jgi:hypothetical protein
MYNEMYSVPFTVSTSTAAFTERPFETVNNDPLVWVNRRRTFQVYFR